MKNLATYPFFVITVIYMLSNSMVYGDTYQVTNTLVNSSPGSLQWAIQEANANPGSDTILFTISGTPPHTISISGAALPILTGSGTIIDGTSQPMNGYTGSSPKIIIDGSQLGSGNGISISGSDCSLFGLYITGFPNRGVYLSALANGFSIGEAFKGNVISGNLYHGIEVDGANDGHIQGNKIGVDPDGLVAVPNQYSGVFLQNGADYNTIGGPGSSGNIISGNWYFGVEIECCSNNQIKGNKIGVDISGVIALSNYYSGIFIGFTTSNYGCLATNNQVGGTGPGEENIIGHNFYYGINICGQNAYYNSVSRNSVFCNSYGGISLVDGNYGQPNGNNSFAKPIITSASPTVASGTAAANAIVELFLDDNCSSCQGRDYIATVNANATGSWSYSGPLFGSLTATATDPVNGNSSEFATCFFISGNLPPVAALVGLPIAICAGDCVTYTDYSVNTPTSWQWSFPGGNPSSSTVQNPGQVCYNAPGVFEVQLIVANSTGIDTLLIPNYISVFATPGNVTLTTGSPYCTTDGLQTLTADVPGGIWLGTGIVDSVNGVFDPSLAGIGNFLITYLLSNSGGCDFVDTISVIVTDVPVAGFSATASGPTITFANNSLNATSYFWDFGDGATSTLVSPTHTFTTTGAFTITLIAYNSCGSDTFTSIIKVFVSGIEEAEAGHPCIIVPNPASMYIDVNCNTAIPVDAMIALTDVTGKQVMKDVPLSDKVEGKVTIKVNELAPGIYFLSILELQKAHTYKVVVR